MTDAHLHMTDTIALSGLSLQVCALRDGGVEPRDLKGVGDKIRVYAASRPVGALIIGSNYIAAGIEEGRLPNRFELDEWTGGGRAWILNLDGHSSACSTSFLRELGLETDAPDGILTGTVHDFNLGRITEKLAAAVTPRIFGDGVAAFNNTCAGYGIGRVCALEGNEHGGRIPCGAGRFFCATLSALCASVPQYMDEKFIASLSGAWRPGSGLYKWELDALSAPAPQRLKRRLRTGPGQALLFGRGAIRNGPALRRKGLFHQRPRHRRMRR
jgi:hypothetical protein